MELCKDAITIRLPVSTQIDQIDLIGFWYVKECVDGVVTLESVVVGNPTQTPLLGVERKQWFLWGDPLVTHPSLPSKIEYLSGDSTLEMLLDFFRHSTLKSPVHKAVFTASGVDVLPIKKYLTLSTVNPNHGLQVRIHVGECVRVDNFGFTEALGSSYTWQVYSGKNELIFIRDNVLTVPRLEYRSGIGAFIAVLPEKEVLIANCKALEESAMLLSIREKYEHLINED